MSITFAKNIAKVKITQLEVFFFLKYFPTLYFKLYVFIFSNLKCLLTLPKP